MITKKELHYTLNQIANALTILSVMIIINKI